MFNVYEQITVFLLSTTSINYQKCALLVCLLALEVMISIPKISAFSALNVYHFLKFLRNLGCVNLFFIIFAFRKVDVVVLQNLKS